MGSQGEGSQGEGSQGEASQEEGGKSSQGEGEESQDGGQDDEETPAPSAKVPQAFSPTITVEPLQSSHNNVSILARCLHNFHGRP